MTERGIGPALEVLAYSSAVPVEICCSVDGRLPEPFEAAAYFVVAEALANVTKHARASSATVTLIVGGGRVLVGVRDDGRGGADARNGSGLRGLADRLQALDAE